MVRKSFDLCFEAKLKGLIIYNNLPCCPIDILATKDNRMSVADILNDRNYFPNPKDEETVEQYFSGIPQIKFSSGKSGQNLREISRSAQRTSMWHFLYFIACLLENFWSDKV
ncbi:hypothetical protein PSHT_15183 [Puccinia striiformis]|uniref:Uncharacterized protein n=1 Tax=Puccinia striiformis TaxID=27350 RepID=A0A2S4UGF7_9BASI|nr:hypothetical protein PSHT_15183 [Puccinia striiformis]